MPNVVGLSLEEAQQKLSDAGFKLDDKGPQMSPDVAEGLVASQDPKAGTPMRKGGSVSIWISSGNGPVPLPNVVGLDRVTAVDMLESLGLQVLVEDEPTDDQSKINYVQRQDPAPGPEVQPGSTVTIWVAVPNNIVKVPNLVGMSRAAAETNLVSLGLVPKVTEVDSELPGGTVITQDPAPGTELQAGDQVAIEVSNGPVQNTVWVPPVAQLGYTLTQAKNLLTQYHLKSSVEYYEIADSTQWDKVIQQDPVAGAVVPAGTTVKLTVGKAPTTTTAPPTTAPPTSSPPGTSIP